MQNKELKVFEFSVLHDEKIICQREFKVNKFVKKEKNSLELHEYIKYICNDIGNQLKKNSIKFLFENKNNTEEIQNIELGKNVENNFYVVQLKQDGEVFIQRMLPISSYHIKTRGVDIRQKLKGYLNDLTDILETKNKETTFLTYSLN